MNILLTSCNSKQLLGLFFDYYSKYYSLSSSLAEEEWDDRQTEIWTKPSRLLTSDTFIHFLNKILKESWDLFEDYNREISKKKFDERGNSDTSAIPQKVFSILCGPIKLADKILKLRKEVNHNKDLTSLMMNYFIKLICHPILDILPVSSKGFSFWKHSIIDRLVNDSFSAELLELLIEEIHGRFLNHIEKKETSTQSKLKSFGRFEFDSFFYFDENIA